MRAAYFEQLRSVQRRSLARRRNSLLAVASVGAHILLLMFLPGFAMVSPPVRELVIELSVPQPAEVPAQDPRLAGGGGAKTGTAPIKSTIRKPDAPASPSKPAPAASGPRLAHPKPSSLTTQRGPQATGQPDAGKSNKNTPAKGGNPAKPQPQPAVRPGGSDSTSVVSPPPIVAAPGKQPDVPKPPPADNVGPQPPQNNGKPSKDKGAPAGKPEQGNANSSPGGGGTVKEAPQAAPSKPGNTAPGNATDPGKTPGGQGGSSPSGSPVPGGGPASGPNPGPPGGGAGGNAADPPGPSEADLALLADYGDRCRKLIRQEARNPELATEQGHKGKVKFEFTVSAKGKLLGIEVVDGSSFGELDNECQEATRVAAQYFGRFPKGIPVDKWTFSMTMKFPLY